MAINTPEMTATDNSSIRSFVRKQIMNDRANPTTLPASEAVVSIDATPAQAKDLPKSPAKTTLLGQVPATQPVTDISDEESVPADKKPTTQPTVTASTTDPKDDQGNDPDRDDQ